MTKQAILLPYASYQNEPSKPIPQVFDLPTDKEERKAYLISLFFVYVLDVGIAADIVDLNITVREDCIDDYGDIVVSWDGEVFLYVTLLN